MKIKKYSYLQSLIVFYSKTHLTTPFNLIILLYNNMDL